MTAGPPAGLPPGAVDRLRCPRCRAPFLPPEGGTELRCVCGARFPVVEGFPRLLDEADVTGNDRLLRPFYEYLAPLHDPAVKYTLPLFGSGTEGAFRRGYLPLLDLAGLRGGRILEVGVGAGANLPLVRRELGGPIGGPDGEGATELWGLDYAAGMLRLARRRADRLGIDARLVVGDAHALPFADATFDRVFHVGATNSFRDPKLALAEMARVAKPGTPIVVVDERLDPSRRHSLVHRAIFRAICFYDPYPPEPTTLLPPGAHDVLVEQIARFIYAMRFRVG